MTVGQDLEFDVTGLIDVFFDVDIAVTKGLFRFISGGMELFGEGNVIVGDTHAATTATCNRLNDDWIANLTGDLDCFGFGIDDSI